MTIRGFLLFSFRAFVTEPSHSRFWKIPSLKPLLYLFEGVVRCGFAGTLHFEENPLGNGRLLNRAIPLILAQAY